MWHQTLAEIVDQLPLLTHLDISGTNLAGTGVAQFKAQEEFRSSDIPGLVGRANNPLQFLGLYNTAHSACRRHDIPAIHVNCERAQDDIELSLRGYHSCFDRFRETRTKSKF